VYIVLVVDLPMTSEGYMYTACRLCAAKVGITKCDQTKLDKFMDGRKVSHYRPIGCPLNSSGGGAAKVSPESILKQRMSKRG